MLRVNEKERERETGGVGGGEGGGGAAGGQEEKVPLLKQRQKERDIAKHNS